jgi:hypothetical protein
MQTNDDIPELSEYIVEVVTSCFRIERPLNVPWKAATDRITAALEAFLAQRHTVGSKEPASVREQCAQIAEAHAVNAKAYDDPRRLCISIAEEIRAVTI